MVHDVTNQSVNQSINQNSLYLKRCLVSCALVELMCVDYQYFYQRRSMLNMRKNCALKKYTKIICSPHRHGGVKQAKGSGKVLHQLSDEQCANLLSIATDLRSHYNHEGERFLYRVILINEMVLRDFEPKLKQQSK